MFRTSFSRNTPRRTKTRIKSLTEIDVRPDAVLAPGLLFAMSQKKGVTARCRHTFVDMYVYRLFFDVLFVMVFRRDKFLSHAVGKVALGRDKHPVDVVLTA